MLIILCTNVILLIYIFLCFSALLYMKFLVLWILVILADFILEFRFEFLWPFYLLLRSVYDSFKYQGLAFSVFFVCIALTSDMLCFFLIPVHWLLFAASTYVWVQYVWHTDKGICAPTIIMWMLFVYLEAAVRLKDVKHIPGHLDLCRPFAAHCIGYPVVTLGFGFKSYVGFRMRQKKQRNVAKENEFYLQLMQQALPPESSNSVDVQESTTPAVVLTQNHVQNSKVQSRQSNEKNGHLPNGTIANGIHNSNIQKSHRKVLDKAKDVDQDHKNIEKHVDRQKINHLHTNGVAIIASNEEITSIDTEVKSTRRKEKKEQDKEKEAFEYLQRLEVDSKRLRADLQSSRASEQELRLQVLISIYLQYI